MLVCCTSLNDLVVVSHNFTAFYQVCSRLPGCASVTITQFHENGLEKLLGDWSSTGIAGTNCTRRRRNSYQLHPLRYLFSSSIGDSRTCVLDPGRVLPCCWEHPNVDHNVSLLRSLVYGSPATAVWLYFAQHVHRKHRTNYVFASAQERTQPNLTAFWHCYY